MLTKKGVAYNLKLSPYVVNVNDSAYYFSSKNHKEKFIELITENRNKVNKSLSNRFGFEVYVPNIADMKLYISIETRGFYVVWKDGSDCECVNNLILSGLKGRKKDSTTLLGNLIEK